MDYNYLVPANSKKQSLIFGFLTPTDAIIAAVGIGISFLLFAIFHSASFFISLLIILPAFVSGFLVFPIPNYHNARIFFREMYRFYFVNRRKYVWRGWCYKYEQSNDEQSS
ncbi:MAG: hypothetical protein IJL74_03185 [Bacilli bacterium]|nr:hypothetical protein [Bacilli bacterium]